MYPPDCGHGTEPLCPGMTDLGGVLHALLMVFLADIAVFFGVAAIGAVCAFLCWLGGKINND